MYTNTKGQFTCIISPQREIFFVKCIFHLGVNSIHFHPGVKRSHVQKFFKNVMQSNLIFYFSEKTKKCEWYAKRNIENTAIEYFVENQIKSDQENEGQKEIRRVAFKHELCFEKLFIVSSFFWHFVIRGASSKKMIKFSFFIRFPFYITRLFCSYHESSIYYTPSNILRTIKHHIKTFCIFNYEKHIFHPMLKFRPFFKAGLK